jgi:hypothetical protein
MSSLSAYIAFCEANRDDVKAIPRIKSGDIDPFLKSMWKHMEESERAVYRNPNRIRSSTLKIRSSTPTNELGLRRSGRLRNKRLGLNFWGVKL